MLVAYFRQWGPFWLMVLMLLSIIAIGGCSKDVVYVTKEVYVRVDGDYLKDCEVQPPPEKEVYLKASERERSIMWSKVYISQLSLIAKCNARLDKARKQNERE